jgi:hypothetical protein
MLACLLGEEEEVESVEGRWRFYSRASQWVGLKGSETMSSDDRNAIVNRA